MDYLENVKGLRFSDPEGEVPVSSFESYQLLLASILTYPLTLASAWEKMGLSTIESPQICILGPETELNLGLNWTPLSDLTRQKASLHFVGPISHDAKETNYGDRLLVDFTSALVENA